MDRQPAAWQTLAEALTGPSGTSGSDCRRCRGREGASAPPGECGAVGRGPASRDGVASHSPASKDASSDGSTLPCTSPSTTTAGAMLQAPRHRAFRTETRPSGVVAPASMPNRPRTSASNARGAVDVARGAGADDTGMKTLGFQGEVRVKSGDAVDLARRHSEAVPDVQQGLVVQVAENLLGGVQHLDQPVGAVAKPPHPYVHLPPTLVVAGS